MRRRVRKEQERCGAVFYILFFKKILHLPAEIVPLHRKILKELVWWRENIKRNMALTIMIYSTHQEAGDFEFWSFPLGLFQYFIQWLFNTKYLSTWRYSNAQFKAACVYVWWKKGTNAYKKKSLMHTAKCMSLMSNSSANSMAAHGIPLDTNTGMAYLRTQTSKGITKLQR